MKTLPLIIFLGMLNACQANSMEYPTIKTTKETIVEMVTKNDLDAVEKALKNGADVNAKDQNKRSLLLIATVNRHAKMAKYLAENGADVNAQDDKLDSPFLYAGASGQTELVTLFLQKGARFDVFNRYNGTALIPACERGHIETVKVLVARKDFPIDHVNRLGWTALMEAVILGDGGKKHQEVVQILKDAGADIKIPDHNHKTPLEHAKSLGFKEIVRILES